MDIQLSLLLVIVSWFRIAGSDTFIIGYLTADYSAQHTSFKQGRIISGAMTIAVQQVNNDPGLLSGHKLEFIWSDTNLDTLNGTRELTLQWQHGAVAFFGPEDSCDVEARVAAAWNLPMISYVSHCVCAYVCACERGCVCAHVYVYVCM